MCGTKGLQGDGHAPATTAPMRLDHAVRHPTTTSSHSPRSYPEAATVPGFLQLQFPQVVDPANQAGLRELIGQVVHLAYGRF